MESNLSAPLPARRDKASPEGTTLLTSEQPLENRHRQITGHGPPGATADVLRDIEDAIDVLDALVRGPGGSLYEDPLQTALDHLYLAASALRHGAASVPEVRPVTDGPGGRAVTG